MPSTRNFAKAILLSLVVFMSNKECSSFSSVSQFSSSTRRHNQYVGFDLGTSGVRISVVEATDSSSSSLVKEVHSHAISWKENANDDANIWFESVEYLLEHAKQALTTLENVQSICVSGTSSSCVLINGKNVGKPSRSPSRMYNYNVISTVTEQGGDPIHGVRA